MYWTWRWGYGKPWLLAWLCAAYMTTLGLFSGLTFSFFWQGFHVLGIFTILDSQFHLQLHSRCYTCKPSLTLSGIIFESHNVCPLTLSFKGPVEISKAVFCVSAEVNNRNIDKLCRLHKLHMGPVEPWLLSQPSMALMAEHRENIPEKAIYFGDPLKQECQSCLLNAVFFHRVNIFYIWAYNLYSLMY